MTQFSAMQKDSCNSVLVTGGCGFLGSHLVKKLTHSEAKIVVVDTQRNSGYKAAEENRRNNILFKKDIRNERVISKIIKKEGVQHCIHLAGLANIRDSTERPYEVIDVNVNGTLSILKACVQNGLKSFIFASSSAVYGESKNHPIKEDEQQLKPVSLYGASKLAGEALVSAYSSFFDATFCLRFFNIYGNRQVSANPSVIQRFKERILKGSSPVIYGDGNQTRDFVHVDDAVNCVLRAYKSTHKYKIHQKNSMVKQSIILNVGSGRPVSIKYLAGQMQKIVLGRSIRPVFSEPIVGDIKHSCADISKCHKILGYKPVVELTDGLLSIMRQSHK